MMKTCNDIARSAYSALDKEGLFCLGTMPQAPEAHGPLVGIPRRKAYFLTNSNLQVSVSANARIIDSLSLNFTEPNNLGVLYCAELTETRVGPCRELRVNTMSDTDHSTYKLMDSFGGIACVIHVTCSEPSRRLQNLHFALETY